MARAGPLSDSLLAGAGRRDEGGSAPLEQAARAFAERARAEQPALAVAPADLLRHVGARIAEEPDLAQILDQLRAGDLAVAYGCAHGDRRALEIFERRFLPEVGAFVARINSSPHFADEVRQSLRRELLLKRPDQSTKIAGYSGRGPLGAWLRIVAVRTAQKLARATGRELPSDGLDRRAAEAPTPELAYLKARYQEEFRVAFSETLEGLDARDRNMLAFHFLDGLTVEAIGTIYGVNKSTITRWMARARESVVARMRELLAERLRLSVSECDSLIGLVRSQLDVSIRRFLRRSDG